MRDGVKLYTVVVMKKGTANGPILLSRTPYDAHHADASRRRASGSSTSCRSDGRRIRRTTATSASIRTSAACIAPKAQCVMNRPLAGPLNDTGIDESTDAYDTIDWLVKNVPEVERQGRHHRLFLPRLHDARWREINPHPGAEGGRARRARWSTAGWATTGSTTAPSASARSTTSVGQATSKARR